MSRRFTLLVSVGVFGAFLALPVLSATGLRGKSHRIKSGRSHMGHLYLHEKNPDTWEIVEDGAWGKMTFNLSGASLRIVFNGHGLEADSEYTLVYYPDPWPGEGLICLGEGTADESGDVHIGGAADDGDLPAITDANSEDGAKLWLVLSEDVDCGDESQMVGWQPTEYLFEYDLITFEDTDE